MDKMLEMRERGRARRDRVERDPRMLPAAQEVRLMLATGQWGKATAEDGIANDILALAPAELTP